MATVKKRSVMSITSMPPKWWACLFALYLLLCGGFAQAETIDSIVTIDNFPATEVTLYNSWYWDCSGQHDFPKRKTPSQAYADFLSGYPAPDCGIGGVELYSSSLEGTTINYCSRWDYQPNQCFYNYSRPLTETISASCPDGYTQNGATCSLTTYTCPTTGRWTLSADQQTCTGCWDASKILNEEGACVSLDDKAAGASGCTDTKAPSNQPPPWTSQP